MTFKDFVGNYDVVVWDWNGTLLNDVAHTHQVISDILFEEGLDRITVDQYKDHFGFPISSYYASLGLPSIGEEFDRVAYKFIDNYKQKYNDLTLFEDTLDLLQTVRDLNVKQYVLSAAHADELKHLLNKFNLHSFFNNIAGASDIYAHGKVEQAKVMRKYFEAQGYKKGVYVGDTDHDYEVSEVLGFDFCFSAEGHQHMHRLTKCRIAYELRDRK